MKKISILLSILLCFAIGLMALSSCGVNDPTSSGDSSVQQSSQSDLSESSEDPGPTESPIADEPCEVHSFDKNVCTVCAAINLNATMGKVAVHDPSIVSAYVDEHGMVYPEKAEGLRKVWFVFGTQLAAAYSFDMENWANFTPMFFAENSFKVVKNTLKIFATASRWAGYTSGGDLRGNLWAADLLYNPVMGKWCMYYSINGDKWLSCDVLLTADDITGPYAYAGTAVWSGMSRNTTGAGNDDYYKVTGDTTIPDRYGKSGIWHGNYGVSGIDPNVFFDEDGELWLLYGSWSGGIFLLKLDNETGLRDYEYDYGYKAEDFAADGAVWDGSSLLFDPYMGIHVAGGYYVSGEGPYIEYIDGYYYLFMSYGFYSPDGGYNMRVFRSENVKGPYVDYSGDSAIFGSWEFNYGDNTKTGVSIMASYQWSWQTVGSVAQGHNSALLDDDGNAYIIYHTKYNDGSVGHNVEVHRLLKTADGWYLPSVFEKSSLDAIVSDIATEDIVGTYGMIVHSGISKKGYENLEVHTEVQITLLADGTVQGAYTGTWSVSEDSQYITLILNGQEYHGALLYQKMDDLEYVTLTFTAMNSEELCIWGYRYPTENWNQ